MTFAQTPRPGPGRKKGVPNRHTLLVKEQIEKAVEKLGGWKRLAEWAKEAPENERIFWGSIYPKLMPLQVTGMNGGALQIVVKKPE